jgi:prolipoprotein diacylglyceryltransferase
MKNRIIDLFVRIYVAIYNTFRMIKYFFRVENDMTDKRRRRRIMIPFAVAMIVVFVSMYAVVYTRSYNIMNSEKLVVFRFDEENEVITVLGRNFSVKK